MEKCRLCGRMDADKKGSHIVPHFILKTIDNESGQSGRDKELGFLIDTFQSSPYFGSAVLPDKLEEIFGELSDDELENAKNIYKSPLIVDNLLCSACEKKLAQIEEEYSKSINKTTSESRALSSIGILFWGSILWRISINAKNGFSLKHRDQTTIQNILNKNLKTKFDDIDIKELEKDTQLMKLSYGIIHSPDYTQEEYLFCHPQYKTPYAIVIGKFVLFFYFNDGYINNILSNFFGFEKYMGDTDINFDDLELRYILKADEFKKCIDTTISFISEQYINNHLTYLDNIHKRIGGKGNEMPFHIKQMILFELLSQEKKLGRRFTRQDVAQTIYKVLSSFAER